MVATRSPKAPARRRIIVPSVHPRPRSENARKPDRLPAILAVGAARHFDSSCPAALLLGDTGRPVGDVTGVWRNRADSAALAFSVCTRIPTGAFSPMIASTLRRAICCAAIAAGFAAAPAFAQQNTGL